jgi:hypothetical protein
MAVRKPFSGVEEWFDHSARGFLNHLPRVIRARQEEKGDSALAQSTKKASSSASPSVPVFVSTATPTTP